MVRFTDGPTTAVSRTIPSPVEEVWAVVSDIGLPTVSSAELQSVEWVAPADGPAVGAVFHGHNRRGDMAWTTECTVTDFERGQRFTWDVSAGEGPLSTWGFVLTPVEGGTEVRQWTRLGPARSGLTWAIRQDPDNEEAIIEGRLSQLRESMAGNLEVIAERCR